MKNNKCILILCLLVFILSLNSIYATTDNIKEDSSIMYTSENNINIENEVYIDCNSESIIEDGSKNSPYKTFNNETMEKISSDSTVHVASGTYNLNPTTFNKNISIIGENSEKVIFSSNSKLSTIIIDENTNVLLKNFTLQDFTSDMNAAITNNGSLIIEQLNLKNNIGTTTQNMGGSIRNNGILTINNTYFGNNTASFGAAIYNTGTVTVSNSHFDANSIYNVGGAIYNNRGNVSIVNSNFTKNRAVSGAAIYNAFGMLYVNNTLFNENDAEHFFGGAIYSTGTSYINNSQFYSNHAKIDGGAITNTHNLTIINSTFEENWANENGGVIENVPWTEVENGNILILNSSFKYNYALKNGGVIINYNKPENMNEKSCITIRNSIFEYNYASKGALIYNEENIDFQYNAFINNYDDNNCMIVSNNSLITSLNNNWWGTNTPSADEIGALPENWVILKFDDKSSLITHTENKIKLLLNTLNNGEPINSSIPPRTAIFSSEKTFSSNQEYPLYDSLDIIIYSLGDTINVQVDEQNLSLQPLNKTIIQIQPIPTIKYNDNLTINANLTDENNNLLNNQEIILDINGEKTSIFTQNGLINYSIPIKSIGNNNLTLTFNGNDIYGSSENKTVFHVLKKPVLYFYNIDNPISNNKVTISGKLLNNNKKINNANITLNINGINKTIIPNYEGYFSYTFIAADGTNNITATYDGNDEYAKTVTSMTFNAKKKTVLYFHNIKDVMLGDTIQITGKLLSDSKAVPKSKITLNLNGYNKTITPGPSGYFSFKYTLNQNENHIIATYNGNDEYASSTTQLNFNTHDNIEFYYYNITDANTYNLTRLRGKLLNNGKGFNNQTVILTINNENYTFTTNKDGYFEMYKYLTDVGENNLTFTYNGNNELLIFKTTFLVQYHTILTLYEIKQPNTSNPIIISGKLIIKERNGNRGLSNQIVTINISKFDQNKTFNVITNKDGYFSIKFNTNETTLYSIQAFYEGNSTIQYADDSSVFFSKNITTIYAYKVDDMILGQNVRISGKLFSKGKPLVSQFISISSIDSAGTHYLNYVKTNNEGYFAAMYSPDVPGEVELIMDFGGDYGNWGSKCSLFITVKDK